MHLPPGTSDHSRTVAGTPDIALLNRFFESDPSNQKDQVALLTRPGLRKWKTLATSPVRAIYSCPGSFAEALFAVGGNTVYRIDTDETVTAIGTLTSSLGAVSMAATDTHLFIADGLALYVYTDDSYSSGTLTASGAISSGEQVRIGSVYYQFTSGDVDTGAPAGTSSNPWLVALGSSIAEALANLYDAIGGTGTAGTDYSLALTGHTEVAVVSYNSTTLVVRPLESGSAGNSIATTETGLNLAWGGATLSGGGSTSFAAVSVPDGDGIVSVGVIAGFCICVVAQGFDRNGRFYWIEPGEITIDPLNFATAERSPDPVWEVVIVGDTFWLPGTSTNETWYPSGDALAPFLRQQGRLFDKGTWEGTVIKIMDEVIAIDAHGNPWRIGAQPMPAGGPGIAERFRIAINQQRSI